MMDQAARHVESDTPLLPDAGKWIWLDEGNAAHSTAAGDVHFRHEWEVSDIKSVTGATIEATADNSLTLSVNGTQVIAGDNFNTINSADILSLLRAGKNTIEKVDTSCAFRVPAGTPQLWDPVTAEIRALPQFTRQKMATSVPMAFEPHQSFFVVFPRDGSSVPATEGTEGNFPRTIPISPLEGPWESGARNQESGQRIYLDLGTVHDMARVRLNGHDLGVVWCAPWRVDVSDAIKPGENQLEIEIANRWPNRLLGDQSAPDKDGSGIGPPGPHGRTTPPTDPDERN